MTAGTQPPRPGRITLTRHTIEQEHRHPDSTGDFSGLLNAIATAVKIIANQVNRGGLAGLHGAAGGENVHGEVQQRLDLASNEVMVAETLWGGHLAALASEEMPDILPVPAPYRRGKYLLLFDPLDGSSNIDVNITVGTIFSVLRAPRPGEEPRLDDFLQPGVTQVCAGFALYGPATMLVLTTGDGVDGFTLDRDVGAFVLTHPRMRIPEQTHEFAINASNERFWEDPVRRYIAECLAGRTGPRGQDCNMRWVASLVADAYRILTRGGVFLYPADTRNADRPGRLRLMYECNPIAFLVEQAGGLASTGRERVMELAPTGLHQRAPLVFGSRAEVERIERYHREPDDRSFDGSLFNVRSMFRAGR
ncbi:class 1 fructose-bisphosphatase [Dactylosporangium sp. NPDC005572]|uniref:class 1 fructose-bisphosphatase n=1 Tax=Dactylosporangium sp. NPDC005572 TaxID=3156889 RepID=UPI0033BD8700